VEWRLGHDSVRVVVKRPKIVFQASLQCDVRTPPSGFSAASRLRNGCAVNFNVWLPNSFLIQAVIKQFPA